jgi:PAS domain-containing protein
MDNLSFWSMIPWNEVITSLGTLIAIMLALGNRKLKNILAETKHNGGSTLKDQMDRIENSLTNLTLWIEASQHLTQKPLFKADEHGKFTWINTAFARLVGGGLEDVRDLGWVSVIHPDDMSRVVKEWGESVRDKRKFDSEFKIQNVYTLEITKVRGRAFPIMNHEKNLGFLGTWLLLEEIKHEGKSERTSRNDETS